MCHEGQRVAIDWDGVVLPFELLFMDPWLMLQLEEVLLTSTGTKRLNGIALTARRP